MQSSQVLSAALMRVNHTGEVCAQALYDAQARFSRDSNVSELLRLSAQEESEHLQWTQQRILQLGGRESLLNPLWFATSYAVGMAAAAVGDRTSLGFLAETERQVVAHLNRQLARLPVDDHPSRAIIRAMRTDESQHAEVAERLGGAELPRPVILLMNVAASVMTTLAFRL